MTEMKLKFLGTGTSTGVPQLRCSCAACTSTDSHDRRLRCSAMVEADGHNLLIDCGPDFRQQMLRYHRNGGIDALLVTHHHYDHIGGADDLRPYMPAPVKVPGLDAGRLGPGFPVYGKPEIEEDLRRRMPYCFQVPPYPGVPRFDFHRVEPFVPFEVCGVEVLPLDVRHYMLDILGFRIGNLAYITDANQLPDRTIEAVRGVDTLVINALRHEPHISHFSLKEALEAIDRIAPRRAYLTHMSHDMGPEAKAATLLPTHVRFAHDGLTLAIPG